MIFTSVFFIYTNLLWGRLQNQPISNSFFPSTPAVLKSVSLPLRLCHKISRFVVVIGQEAVVYHTETHQPEAPTAASGQSTVTDLHGHNVGFTGGFIEKYFGLP